MRWRSAKSNSIVVTLRYVKLALGLKNCLIDTYLLYEIIK